MRLPKVPSRVLTGVLILNLIFLLLLGFSYPHVEPGSGSYVVSVLAVLPIALSFLLAGALLYLNARRSESVPVPD